MQADHHRHLVLFADGAELAQHPLGSGRVERRHRFVREDQAGPLRQGPGNSDPLLLTAGHGVAARQRAVEQPDPLETLERPAPFLGWHRQQGAKKRVVA